MIKCGSIRSNFHIYRPSERFRDGLRKNDEVFFFNDGINIKNIANLIYGILGFISYL